MNSPRAFLHRLRKQVSYRLNKVGLFIGKSYTEHIAVILLGPVSYTHLDVYKRQVSDVEICFETKDTVNK